MASINLDIDISRYVAIITIHPPKSKEFIVLTHNQTTSNHAPDSHYGHFIDDQWVDGESGETSEKKNIYISLNEVPFGVF